MLATSLDETANVSWVDAVVTKGFAPEETHTQQIPTWTIPGYTMKKGRTSGTDAAAHLQDPETLTLGAWGRDLDVHFTLGVRDMKGMKFASALMFLCMSLHAADFTRVVSRNSFLLDLTNVFSTPSTSESIFAMNSIL